MKRKKWLVCYTAGILLLVGLCAFGIQSIPEDRIAAYAGQEFAAYVQESEYEPDGIYTLKSSYLAHDKGFYYVIGELENEEHVRYRYSVPLITIPGTRRYISRTTEGSMMSGVPESEPIHTSRDGFLHYYDIRFHMDSIQAVPDGLSGRTSQMVFIFGCVFAYNVWLKKQRKA